MRVLDRVLQRMRLRKVQPHIRPGARLLDVGCADGVLSRSLPDLGRYVGVDPDAPATTPAARIRFIRDVFPTSQLDPDERFDAVVATAVLEHVPRDDQPTFARACAGHLVTGGTLAITVPAPLVDLILAVLKKTALLDGMKDGQHYGFDPAATPAIFEPHGFLLVRHARFELGLNHLFVFRRV